MIGYEISSSLAGVYTIAKTSLVENFKHELKNDMIANMTTFFFAREVPRGLSFLGNFKPSDKKLDFQRTPT